MVATYISVKDKKYRYYVYVWITSPYWNGFSELTVRLILIKHFMS